MIIKKEEVGKILIIKFRALGDILLSVPAMRAVKDAYPSAKIGVLVNKGGEELLDGQSFVDELLVFDKKSGPVIARDLDLIQEVMDKKYDLVIDMYGNMRSALLAYFSGAKYRAGLSSGSRNMFYNIVVQGSPDIIYNPNVWLRVACASGAALSGGSPSIELGAEAEHYIEAFLKAEGLETGKYAVLNPFASARTREWPGEKYIELATRLANAEKPSVIVWGPGQKEAANAIKIAAGSNVFLAPQTGIKQLGWLLKKSAAVVTGTTFVQHLAVAVGANVVSIFGATDSRAWVDPAYRKQTVLQAKLECMPCEKIDCSDFKCMNEISVLNVLEAVKHYMNG